MNAMYTQWVEIISKVAFLFLQLQKSKEYFYSCQLTRKVTSLFVRNSTFFGFVYIPPWGCFARKKCWISNKSWCHFWIELISWKKPVCTSVLMRNIWNPYDTALKLKTHTVWCVNDGLSRNLRWGFQRIPDNPSLTDHTVYVRLRMRL